MRYSHSIWVAFLALNAALVEAVRAGPPPVVDYPVSGAELGNGWSTLKGGKTNATCIEFRHAKEPAEDVEYSMMRVIDKEQLNQHLRLSAEMQAKSLLGWQASATAQYSRSLEIHSEALSLSIHAVVMPQAEFVANDELKHGIFLTPEALSLAEKDIGKFLVRCGDMYIDSLQKSAGLDALLTFEYKTVDERESQSLAMSGSLGTLSGALNAGSSLKNQKEHHKLQIFVHTSGGSGLAIPVTEEELLSRLKNLSVDTKGAHISRSMTLKPYDELPNWPGKAMGVSRLKQIFDLTSQYLRYRQVYDDISPMLQNPNEYIFPRAINDIAWIQDCIKNFILPPLKYQLAECMDGGSCDMPLQADYLDYEVRAGLPVRRLSYQHDIEVAALYSKFLAAHAADAATAAQIYSNQGGSSSSGGFETNSTLVANPAKAASAAALTAAQSAYIEKAKDNATEFAKATYRQWIAIPNVARCKIDPTQAYCLDNRQQAAYLDTIKDYVLGGEIPLGRFYLDKQRTGAQLGAD